MMYVCCCTKNTTTLSLRCRRCLGSRTITWNVKNHTTTRIGTSVNQITLVIIIIIFIQSQISNVYKDKSSVGL